MRASISSAAARCGGRGGFFGSGAGRPDAAALSCARARAHIHMCVNRAQRRALDLDQTVTAGRRPRPPLRRSKERHSQAASSPAAPHAPLLCPAACGTCAARPCSARPAPCVPRQLGQSINNSLPYASRRRKQRRAGTAPPTTPAPPSPTPVKKPARKVEPRIARKAEEACLLCGGAGRWAPITNAHVPKDGEVQLRKLLRQRGATLAGPVAERQLVEEHNAEVPSALLQSRPEQKALNLRRMSRAAPHRQQEMSAAHRKQRARLMRTTWKRKGIEVITGEHRHILDNDKAMGTRCPLGATED
eukprot:353000-Chlamydomonas_euryale.AAC.29